MTDGITGQIYCQSTNATQVINEAIDNLTQDQSIQFNSGIYNLSGSITGINKNNITLAFQNGALLFIANGMNTPAICLDSANNWLIQNPTINGNANNQGIDVDGMGSIEITNSSNCYVTGAYIYNCRQYGFFTFGNVVHDGVTNSKIINCGWNGMMLGSGSNSNQPEQALYATNNEVAYCGDVGISNAGYLDIIQNNYVHDMNGTTGYNNANWGIAVEGGGNNTVTGNTMTNCDIGITLNAVDGTLYGPADLNTVSLNTIKNCNVGIGVNTNYNNINENDILNSNSGITVSANSNSNTIVLNNIEHCNQGIYIQSRYNIVNENQITQYDYLGGNANAMVLSGASNNLVSGNILNSSYAVSGAIYLGSSDNNQISNNTIVATNMDWYEITVEGHGNFVELNQIKGNAGILVNSGSSNTIIQSNNLVQCTWNKISDSGIATSIYNNTGYNPVGYIASPISGSTNYIVDSGSTFAWISGRVYINTESPKVLNISAGTVSVIAQNGVTLFTATGCTMTLQPGDTFSVTFTITPTINVIGQ